MHFWIDKRSSQLHNYGGAGRGRPPGSGGFYSRTFGSRHHPPLMLRSSNSTSCNHAPFRPPTQNPSSNSSPSVNPNPSLSLQSSSSSSVACPQQNTSQQQQQQQNSSTCDDSFLNISSVQCPSSSSSSNTNRVLFHSCGTDQYNHLHHHQPHHSDQTGFPNNPNPQMVTSGVPTNHVHLCEGSSAVSAANNYHGGMMARGVAEGTHQHVPCQHVIRILSGDTNSTHLRFSSPFLRGGLGGGGYPPSRRPRSQVQGSQIISVGRRRSSGGVNSNGNSGNPNGGAARRTSSGTNRWSYDPYNLHQNRSSIHHHTPVHMVDSRSRSEWSNIPTPTSPETVTGLSSPISISNSGELHNPNAGMNPSNHTTLIPRELQGSTSTNNSLVDPAWKRTKRIGLTLCFMSFILLSTVAAKFFIEGPGIIDKTPKSERTESAIYFFLTELIFVAFAMALFFTGITCLRKRTNAYLLRQFNQYIMQSSSSGGGGGAPGGVGGVGGDFFDSPTGTSGISSGVNSSGSVMGGLGSSGGLHHHHSHSGILVDRPYHHYLPAFDTHVMMNVSGLQSSRFSDGYAKPPPYHIALYLPAPDSQQISKTDGEDMKAARISSGSRILGGTAEPDPASFISSEASFLCEKTDESDEDDGDEESLGPDRKKLRKESNDSRPETPPPPYGQI